MSTTTYATTEERRSAIRVPLDEPTTMFDKAVAWYCRKNYGDVLDNALALMHNRKVLKATFAFEKKVAKWDALDPDLKVLAQAASASTIGCSWCMDFGYYAAHSQGLDTSKLGEIPFWRESKVFTSLERRVLEYAEAMTVTPPEVTDELADALRQDLGNDGFVELTMMVAVENERSRMNSALGLTRGSRTTVTWGPPVPEVPAGTTSGDPFVEHRGLLFTVAYEMLGSTADAEDVLQESWLRWAARNEDSDQGEVRDPRAYLVRIVTRQSLNRLRTLQRQRETYVGPWLPEPLVTAPDVLEDVELAESVSFAMLLVLETLSPLERAAFVLREVFGFEYDEIADATDRSPAAVRQLVARARNHVQARRPRFERPAEIEEITARFFAAASNGELQPLLDMLAPDVVLLSDGGGKKQAALRPLHGADKVARWLLGVAAKTPNVDARWVVANGNVSVLLYADGELDSIGTVYTVDGKITEIYLVRNPDKLTGIGVPREISAR